MTNHNLARSMLLGLSILLSMSASSWGDENAKEGGKKSDLDLLQGEWVLTILEVRDEYSNGVVLPETYDGRLLIKGDNVTISLVLQGTKSEHSYRVELDPTKKPKHFDALISKDKIHKGIYEIDGGTLTHCNGKLDGPRPTSFERGVYWVWKRTLPKVGDDGGDRKSLDPSEVKRDVPPEQGPHQ